MRPASVGFQCVECVKEGARSTRSGRTAYGGEISANPALTSIALIVVNVAVWLLVLATGGSSGSLLRHIELLPESAWYNNNGVPELIRGVSDGAWWQPLTSMFAHVQPLHIGLNMLALWFLGPQLEAVLGRARFLALYLISGLAGSAAVMLLGDPHTLTLGASGAVFGLMGALVLVALKVGASPSPILMWIGLNLVITFTVPGISWQAHLGGLLSGALLAAIVAYAPRGSQRALLQFGGMALVAVATLALIAFRALTLG